MTSCAVLGVCVPAGLAEDVIGRRRATRTDRRTKFVFCFVLVVWFVCCEIHQQQKQNGARLEHVAYSLRRLSVVGT